MTFIHEKPGWPQFSWDNDALAVPLAAVRHKQGKHLGKMEALGFDLRGEANLSVLTSEVVNSSAIEGETLNPEEVRSSIARRLGLDVAGLPEPGREVEGVVEMTLDATQNFEAPLTNERLFGWHASLFPTARNGMSRITIGAWRPEEAGPMQVVSGPIGREKVHFEAPEAERLDSEMTRFLEWFNSSPAIDPVLRAGIAHFWFVTIHPFEDGNGRIARAIGNAENSLAAVLHKAKLWQRINRRPVNNRQREVINLMLGGFEGFLTTSKYAKLVKCSQDTALRDIRELLERGIIVQNPGRGRSTSYRLAERDKE